MGARAWSGYARGVRGALPREAFRAAPTRVLWLVVHAAVAAAAILAVARGVGGWPLAPLFSLVIGHSFACAGFVAHEALHGSIVRGQRLRRVIGWVGFLPFLFSSRVWVAWHNKLHHAHTGHVTRDPDTYATLEQYRTRRALRWVHRVTPGCGHRAGWLTLLFGLSAQGTKMLLGARKVLGLSRRERVAAVLEVVAAAAVWTALAVALGPARFVFAYIVPLLVANVVLTSYILTNHSLSPLTEANDPLLNSLSVTTPRLIEVLHLNFGYHVEHHLFPAMSPRFAPLVRREIVERWPERYQTMPLWRALRRIFASSRLYADAHTLIDPADGRRFGTLAPRASALAPVGQRSMVTTLL